MWRPSGWENPYPYNPKPTTKLLNTSYNAYEMGATTMLRALKESEFTTRVERGQKDTLGHKFIRSGLVVFIPEDK